MTSAEPTEVVSDAAGLAALLERDGVAFERLGDGNTIQVANKIDGVAAPLFIVWDDSNGCVQVVQTVPPPVPPERFADAAVEMVRTNHQLALPGFGVNPATGVAYVRAVVLLDGDPARRVAGVVGLRRNVAAVTALAREYGPRVAASWTRPTVPEEGSQA